MRLLIMANVALFEVVTSINRMIQLENGHHVDAILALRNFVLPARSDDDEAMLVIDSEDNRPCYYESRHKYV
jgi:hypothetical protein